MLITPQHTTRASLTILSANVFAVSCCCHWLSCGCYCQPAIVVITNCGIHMLLLMLVLTMIIFCYCSCCFRYQTRLPASSWVFSCANIYLCVCMCQDCCENCSTTHIHMQLYSRELPHRCWLVYWCTVINYETFP